VRGQPGNRPGAGRILSELAIESRFINGERLHRIDARAGGIAR
jgi:hypothetical protein